MKEGYIYILSNKSRSVLYIGATRNLLERVRLHRSGRAALFTRKYNVTELLYFERYLDHKEAFAREKQLKNWKRKWKFNLIVQFNPELKDLYLELKKKVI